MTADEFNESARVPKAQFDEAAREGEFMYGPFEESFDFHGAPYIPYPRVYGRLRGGRFVWAYLRTSPPNVPNP